MLGILLLISIHVLTVLTDYLRYKILLRNLNSKLVKIK